MNVTWQYKPVKSGGTKIILAVMIIACALLSVPAHIVKWLFDGRGYYKENGFYSPNRLSIIIGLALVAGLWILL